VLPLSASIWLDAAANGVVASTLEEEVASVPGDTLVYRCPWLVLACGLATLSLVAAEDGIPADRLDKLKAATVYVKVEGREGTAIGSGFLIRVEGQTGLAVTNDHTIAAEPGRFTPEKVSLVFWSGTKKERILPAEVVASDPERDLAVLKVTGKDLPAPLDLSQKVKLRGEVDRRAIRNRRAAAI
jgi:S1-C subfamily serine protease